METDHRNYAVIIADVSGSKQLSGKNRYQTQLFLKSAIVQINEEFADYIEAPFTITKGDEFQGLLVDMCHAYEIVLTFEKVLFPVKLRFGMGVGPIYRMGGKLPIEMDGPAFHRANAALNRAKKKKVSYFLITDNAQVDLLVNTSFQLIHAIKSRWNQRIFRLYWRYKDLGTYREVAAVEKITPQAVCDALKTNRATDVKSAEENLLAYFAEYPLCLNHSEALPSEEEVDPFR